MLRSRLLRKLYAGYVALIAMTALVVGILHSEQIETDAHEDTIDLLRGQAALLREISIDTLRAGELSTELERQLTQLVPQTGVRFTVIRPDGIVLADSHEQASRMNNHPNARTITVDVTTAIAVTRNWIDPRRMAQPADSGSAAIR